GCVYVSLSVATSHFLAICAGKLMLLVCMCLVYSVHTKPPGIVLGQKWLSLFLFILEKEGTDLVFF
uniref:Uncharacterized protein n=1 Tax=Sparus aurata TaxID=8175 RepID=A0A671XPL9_SPAAU